MIDSELILDSDTDPVVANLQAQTSALATVPPDTLLKAIENALGSQYAIATAAGNEAAKADIMTAWNNAQEQHAQIVRRNEVLHGALAVARNLSQQRDTSARELADFIDALNRRDGDHPLLGVAIQDIYNEAYGNARFDLRDEGRTNADYHQGYSDATNVSAEEGRIAVADDIAYTGALDYGTAKHILDGLTGNTPITGEMLMTLIEGFERLHRETLHAADMIEIQVGVLQSLHDEAGS